MTGCISRNAVLSGRRVLRYDKHYSLMAEICHILRWSHINGESIGISPFFTQYQILPPVTRLYVVLACVVAKTEICSEGIKLSAINLWDRYIWRYFLGRLQNLIYIVIINSLYIVIIGNCTARSKEQINENNYIWFYHLFFLRKIYLLYIYPLEQ